MPGPGEHKPPSELAPLRLRLLGQPALLTAADSASPLSPKDAALLAVLALEGAQAREHLAAWLWPDKPPAKRLDSLRQRLMRLDGRCPRPLFVREGNTVALSGDVAHDLSATEIPSALEPGRPLLGSLRFDDLPELNDWLARARRRLRETWHQAWAAEAETLEQQREVAAALPLARRLADDEALHEHAWRRLMRLHYLRGDRGAAQAAYAELAGRLQRELGSTPGGETRELAALIDRGGRLPTGPLAAATTAEQRAQLMRPATLLQRQVQWQQMGEAWGAHGNVLLVGEGGIGKSRLMSDFADTHGVALRVGARPGDSAVPYALAGRLLHACAASMDALDSDTRAELARLDPRFGQAAAGPLLPLRLARAVSALLGAHATLAIDDLHHADSASLELLPMLLEPPRHALLASRPQASGGSDTLPFALAPALADWARDNPLLRTVTLEPLSADTIAELLATLAPTLQPAPDWAAALLRHTGGNPHLLLETLRALLREAPQGPPPSALPTTAPMQQLVAQRLRSLSPDARALAHVSALAGGDFDASLAAHVLQRSVAAVLDPWQELQAAQLMNERGFVHDLIGEAVRASTPAGPARALHRRIAEHLQASGGAAARTAAHWAQAGEPAHAAASHAKAARAAAAASRRDDEQQHWAAAARAWREAGDAAAAFDAEVQQALCLALAGRIDESRTLSHALQQSAATAVQRAQAAHAMAHALTQASEWTAALARAEQAAEQAGTAELPELQARSLLLAGAAAAQLGQFEHSLRVIEQAETLPATDRLAAPHRLRLAEIKAYVLDRFGRFAEAEQMAAEAIALARELGEDTERMTLHNNRSTMLGRLGRVQDAQAEAHEAAALGERLGLLSGYQGLVVRLHRGLFDAYAGDFRHSIGDLEAAIAGNHQLGLDVTVTIVEHQLAFIWMAIGQVARAQRIVSAPLDGLPRTLAARRLGLRQRLARLCGTPPGRWPDDWLDPTVELGVAMSTRLDRARTVHDADECRAVAAQCQRMTLTSGWLNARIALVETLLHADPATAAAEARTLWYDLGSLQPTDAWWPEILHVLQQALRGDGDGAAADTLVRQAAGWLDRARNTLPEHFRASFDELNRVNAALRQQHRLSSASDAAAGDATLQSRLAS